MHLIFSDQALPDSQVKSLFLAGPSPRHFAEEDWRHEALKELTDRGFDGTVFIPIPRHRFYKDGNFANEPSWTYDGQIEWEKNARAMSDLVTFWVPRVIDTEKADLGMPGFTTNVEFGEDLSSGKLLYGRPQWAVKCAYLDQRVASAGGTAHDDVGSLMQSAIDRLGEGALRSGGESRVPLFIWNTAYFKGWYANLLKAGNRLDDARVLNQITVSRGFLFCYALKVKIWVAAEGRHKSNEFFVARPDISIVVAAYRDRSGPEEVVRMALVREFRSTVNNEVGYVYEMAAGSTTKPGTAPEVNAQQELKEELGLVIEDLTRFKHVAKRQLMATFSVHRADVYAVELTEPEFRQLEALALSGEARGEAADDPTSTGERTYVELTTLAEVFKLPVDFSTLGVLFEASRTLGLVKV